MNPVEAILGPRPYNDPPPFPASAPDDAEVAALFDAIRSANHGIVRTTALALAGATSPAREKILLATIEAVIEGWKDGFYEGALYTQHSSKPEIHAEYNRWYKVTMGRASEIQMLLWALGERPADSVMERLAAIRARSTASQAKLHIGNYLLGQRNNQLDEQRFAAPRDVLEGIASTLAPGDYTVFEHAVRATFLLHGSDGLRDRIDPLLKHAKDDDARRSIMNAVCRAGIQRLVTADPSWIDRAAVMFSDPAGINYHLQQLNRLDLWMRALRFPMCSVVFHGATQGIKYLDDAAAAPALRELAATFPTTPTPEDARSKPTLDRLAKYLERDRKKKLPKPPARKDGLGTDGGPILLLSPAAAKAWKGSPKDYGEPTCDPNNDYDRACDAPTGDRIAAIDVGGEKAIVLPEQGCQLATVAKLPWIILRGEDDEIVWSVLGPEAIPFEQTGIKLTVGADGLLLLDAAYPGAKASGRKKAIKLAAGEYAVEELYVHDERGSLHLVRLKP